MPGSVPNVKMRSRLRWLLIGETLFLLAVAGGVAYQVRLVDQKITEMADLKDPSPFTANLFFHLQQIHLNLLAYVQTHDPQVLGRLRAAQTEFNTSIDNFHQMNPRLFPDASKDQILQAYHPFQQSLETLLPLSDAQSTQWSELLQNGDRIIYQFENRLRPLVRPSQPMYLQRLDLTINLQNLVRAVPRNLTQYVLGLNAGEVQEQEIAKDDERFERFLTMYQHLAVFESERKLLYTLEGLWTENTALAQKIIALQKSKSTAYTTMLDSSNQLQDTISKVLPAVRPEVIDQKKTAILHSIMLLIVFSGAMVLLGIGSMIYSVLWIYRHSRTRPAAPQEADDIDTMEASVLRPLLEGWIRINLRGAISSWKGDAEAMYGYSAEEVIGKSIATLFASDGDIKGLHESLKSGKQASFDTTHLRKNGQSLSVHLRFSPVFNAAKKIEAIDLTVHELASTAQSAA